VKAGRHTKKKELKFMPVFADPEGISAKLIQEFHDFTGRRVLEIGCGNGRITMAIAEHSQHVTAIDPLQDDIQSAQQKTPSHLKEKVNFIATGIEEYDLPSGAPKFDIAIFTWSL
jgi:2-polyprenyl-3-methyl-5-hydroxy-6-metoxy-1,4-benzoquinol methylase